jgi:hypothetical protein
MAGAFCLKNKRNVGVGNDSDAIVVETFGIALTDK